MQKRWILGGLIWTLAPVWAQALDSDGDGLPDVWEREGVTVQGVWLDLPGMGADPLRGARGGRQWVVADSDPGPLGSDYFGFGTALSRSDRVATGLVGNPAPPPEPRHWHLQAGCSSYSWKKITRLINIACAPLIALTQLHQVANRGPILTARSR